MNQKSNGSANHGVKHQDNGTHDHKSTIEKAEAQQDQRENVSSNQSKAKKTARPHERHMTSKERGGIL